jgi:hypothetical protein
MATLLLIIGIIAIIVGIVGIIKDRNDGFGVIPCVCAIVVGVCLFIKFEKQEGDILYKTTWYNVITGKQGEEIRRNGNNPFDMQELKKQRESQEIKAMAEKILPHKTNRMYSDGFNSTPIYNDNNGRDYIIQRQKDNSTSKIIYLDNGEERTLNQAVCIILGL